MKHLLLQPDTTDQIEIVVDSLIIVHFLSPDHRITDEKNFIMLLSVAAPAEMRPVIAHTFVPAQRPVIRSRLKVLPTEPTNVYNGAQPPKKDKCDNPFYR